MKILFLSMHYKPEPCDSRTSKLAEGMARAGHETTVVSSFPNYPFGKVYDGYKQSIREQKSIDGVNVIRVPMFPDHSKNKKRRMLSYLSFGASATFLGSLFSKRPDLMWIHHPPLTTGIAGYLMAKLKRVPYVYEIHDLWPQTLVSTGMVSEGKLTQKIQKVCNFLHKRAAAIVVTSPGMKQQLILDGIDEFKIHVFPQWSQSESIPSEKNPATGAKYNLEGKFNILFTGNLGTAQGLDTILDAAKLVSHREDIQISLVGAGVELDHLQSRVSEEQIANVKFTGQVSHEEVQELWQWADGLLVHLKRDPLFAITIPSKTQAYLAAGRPVLCGVDGDGGELVQQTGGGICFASEDPQAMANAILDLAKMSSTERQTMAAKARQGYINLCSQDLLLRQYELLFETVTGKVAPNLVLIENEEAQDRQVA